MTRPHDAQTPRTSLRSFIEDGCDARPEDRHHAIQELDELERELQAERERVRKETIEECAKVCEAIVAEWKEDSEAHAEKQNFHVAVASMHYKNGADECVSAIRAISCAESAPEGGKDEA